VGGIQALNPDNPLKSHAVQMRNAMTPAEAVLWSILRTPPLNAWHFRRQVVFPPRHIVDFCSHAARIVVEADGESHVLGHARDVERDKWLSAQGYRVVRLENGQILKNRDGVFQQLCAILAQHEPPPRRACRASRPSPQGGGS